MTDNLNREFVSELCDLVFEEPKKSKGALIAYSKLSSQAVYSKFEDLLRVRDELIEKTVLKGITEYEDGLFRRIRKSDIVTVPKVEMKYAVELPDTRLNVMEHTGFFCLFHIYGGVLLRTRLLRGKVERRVEDFKRTKFELTVNGVTHDYTLQDALKQLNDAINELFLVYELVEFSRTFSMDYGRVHEWECGDVSFEVRTTDAGCKIYRKSFYASDTDVLPEDDECVIDLPEVLYNVMGSENVNTSWLNFAYYDRKFDAIIEKADAACAVANALVDDYEKRFGDCLIRGKKWFFVQV